MPTFGLEEEVFVTEPTLPSLRSLYYLARLLAKDPRYYYIHSASNFARLPDLRHGVMSGIELSTGIHLSPAELIADLKLRRMDLASVASGLIVAAGHLLEHDTPTNVCGLQIHLGSTDDKERTYRNIVHFLPLLMLLTANSPSVNGRYFGKSYRIYNSFAIGPIAEDRTVRFQDIIFSKRLGTIEVRVCDPVWDISRVSWLIESLAAIEQVHSDFDFDPVAYNELRLLSAKSGYTEHHQKLYNELSGILDIPESLFLSSPADTMWSVYKMHGAEIAYSASDNGYRTGVFAPDRMPGRRSATRFLSAAAGIIGYWIPKLPYHTWKAIVES